MFSFWRTASPPWFHLLQTTETGFSKNAIFPLCWSKDGFRVEYGMRCKLRGTVQGWQQQAVCYFSSASEPKNPVIYHRDRRIPSLLCIPCCESQFRLWWKNDLFKRSSHKHQGWNMVLFHPKGSGLAYIVAGGDKQAPLYSAGCESALMVQTQTPAWKAEVRNQLFWLLVKLGAKRAAKTQVFA